MDLKQLSFKFNRIIYILNRVFAKYNKYQIINTRVDKLNDELDVFIQYEITTDDGVHINNDIVSIPNWLLEANENDDGVEYEYCISMLEDLLEC